jgi:glycerol-3-phosphate dehydrogenase (NAD(P)+)
MAVPAQRLRNVAQHLADAGVHPQILVSAAKGIEQGSLARMTQILHEVFGNPTALCALSGPSHAEEVSRRLPCSLVAAAAAAETAGKVQDLFMTEWIRVYTSQDVIGVELGGALKNVIAIAAGLVDGLGLGDNAKAALVTRGLAEMRRLGEALGARPETFAGLSGLGDLVVTCMSRHSRNRRVGEELGQGRKLAEILGHMEMVAEGVETARSAASLAEKNGLEMPITDQVNRILFADAVPAEAVSRLMLRSRKAEA